MTTHLDHIVIAAPDLNELVTRFTELTGLTPIEGGHHETGTANALVPLAEPQGSYIELIGPDPEAETITTDNFGIASTNATEPRVAAWCIRPENLDELATVYSELRIEPNEVEPMKRHTPDGSVLTWRLIRPKPGADYAPVPFAIDWQDSSHPSTLEEPLASVDALIIHNDTTALPKLAKDFAEDLGKVVEIKEGQPFIELILDTPKGLVNIRDL